MEFTEGFALLKELGYTKEEMDYMWNALIGKHKLITQFDKSGVKWTDLNSSAISTLPREFKNAGLELPQRE